MDADNSNQVMESIIENHYPETSDQQFPTYPDTSDDSFDSSILDEDHPESELDESITNCRLSSPKRERCPYCDQFRKNCICSSDEDNLDSSLPYCKWKVQLEVPFEENGIEDIPEALSGHFCPAYFPQYTNKNTVALEYIRQRLLGPILNFDE